MQHRIIAATASAMLTVSAGAAHATSFVDIVDPVNPTFTQALGINDASTIVGYGNATTFNGFQLVLPPVPANFTRQNVPGADGGTQVTGISGTGTTVGFSITGGVTNGFAQTGGTFTTVNTPGSVFNQLLGINKAGTVAAGYFSATDVGGATGQQAITVAGGPSFIAPVFTNINAALPANTNSQATGVNDSGLVVGFYLMADGDFSAFTDLSGTITSFEAPGSASTQALGVNDLGEIVGDYLDAGGVMHGFLDDAGVFTNIDPSGSTGTTANGINDQGRIVGFFTDANNNTIGFVTAAAVPEPTTLLLFGSGLVGLAFACWRRSAPGKRA